MQKTNNIFEIYHPAGCACRKQQVQTFESRMVHKQISWIHSKCLAFYEHFYEQREIRKISFSYRLQLLFSVFFFTHAKRLSSVIIEKH